MNHLVFVILAAFLNAATTAGKRIEVDNNNGTHKLYSVRKTSNGLGEMYGEVNSTGFIPKVNQHKRSSSEQILIVDMSYATQQNVLIHAREAFRFYSTPLDMARHIKKLLDRNLYGYYNCIVGTSFSYYISYDLRHLIFFRMNGYYILVFRRGSRPIR
ncbi:uncharacterized protein LOC127710701 [Mytilus californianus]|uniref:uncharacterized protein LOC127710701 n=1 Tax=Mytilus californianus TaxID=6549 RepID=UPI002247E27D|nr:uncharacterized protein LOC127710701 [Mytilus californianus]